MDVPSVSIIGTGDYGQAIGKRLLKAGYQVNYGSRNPLGRDLARVDEIFAEARMMSIEDCIMKAEIIILALHVRNHRSLRPYDRLLVGKVLVDVSNPHKRRTESNAQTLSHLFPKALVVKAFNTVSAYAMESDTAGENSTVYICGDEVVARQAVGKLASDMGFQPRDCGGLQSARELELKSITLFKGWGAASVVTLLIFLFWACYGIARYHYIKDNPYAWERLPTNTMNKIIGCTSLTLIAVIFMAGSIAAIAQIINGTKHKRFPAWLDKWLQIRKQLGLYALGFAALHTVMSVTLLTPAYYSKFFGTSSYTIKANMTEDMVIKLDSRMNWIGEVVVLFGTLGIFSMSILGITSLPSVSGKLNWREWRFIQSYLGVFCLVISTAHVITNGAPKWATTPMFSLVQKLSFIVLWIPVLSIFLRFLMLLPCISCYVWKIRSGHERGVRKDVEKVTISSSDNISKKDMVQIHDIDSFSFTQGEKGVQNEAFHLEGEKL